MNFVEIFILSVSFSSMKTVELKIYKPDWISPESKLFNFLFNTFWEFGFVHVC